MENRSAIKRTNVDFIEVKRGNTIGGINRNTSELCSIIHNGVEIMWGGGLPESMKTSEEKEDWQHSTIDMVPIFSSVPCNVVTVDGKEYPMQQHGLSRYAGWKLLKATDTEVSFLQVYYAGTVINSEKGPSSFPFSFAIQKEILCKEDAIVVKFKIENLSEKKMPLSAGYHPAVIRKEEMSISIGGHVYSPTDVEKSKGNTLLVRNSNEAKCFVSGQKRFTMKTNFNHIQLWCPSQRLMAIEPITAPSSKEYEGELKNKPGYMALDPKDTAEFYVKISFDDLNESIKRELR